MAGYQKIGATRKKTFHILPRRTDQWNPAGQRLKRSNGWNARQRLDIGLTRDMDRDPETGKDLGHSIVWPPSGMLNACRCQCLTRLLGIAYAVHPSLHSYGCPWA